MIVRLQKNIDTKYIVSNASNGKITALQTNILLALISNGNMCVLDLIVHVKKSNPVSYKFVDDQAFYRAIYQLTNKNMVVYS